MHQWMPGHGVTCVRPDGRALAGWPPPQEQSIWKSRSAGSWRQAAGTDARHGVKIAGVAVYGVDISSHQPGFDFAANRRVCPFVILKQTEGLSWPDQDDPDATEMLRSYRQEAQAAGYAWVGLYHFARPQPGRTGRDEAEHFAGFVGDLARNEGVILDFEMNAGLGFEGLEDFAVDFVDTIEARYPTMAQRVLFYSYPSFLANMSTDRLVRRCPLWIAAYGRDDGLEHPEAVGLDRWEASSLWQFTSRGHMAGHRGELDVNRFEGDEAMLAESGPGRAGQRRRVRARRGDHPQWPGQYLRRGSHGDGVRIIQERLAARGWAIELEGEFGRPTDTVVRSFQREKGIPVDGVVSEDVWDAIFIEPVTPAEVQRRRAARHNRLPQRRGRFRNRMGDPAGQIAEWGFEDGVADFQIAFAWHDIDVDGDAGPQTAGAVQKVIDEGGLLSPHFEMDEFRSRGNGRVKCHRELLRALERARESVGPITIVSGYRDPDYNAFIGGAKNSQHLYGTAADIRFGLKIANHVGYSGIGTCGDTCLHGDVRHAGPNNTSGGTPEAPTYWAYC
jgi:GH25 family lysozyme M1 (1,4-beta-N-acetylmuramidase)